MCGFLYDVALCVCVYIGAHTLGSLAASAFVKWRNN